MGILTPEELQGLGVLPEPQAPTKAIAPLEEIAGVVPKALKGTLASLVSYGASLTQDKETETTALPEKEQLSWQSRAQRWAADVHQEIAESVEKNPYMKYDVIGLGMKLGDIAMLGPSLAPSVASLGTGYVGSQVGAVLGAPVGPVGAAAGSFMGGLALSLLPLDKAVATQTLYDSLANARDYLIQKGVSYTPEVENELKKTFIEKATEVGHWESIPEAIGSMLELGVVAGIGRRVPILKHALKLKTAEDFGKAALTDRALDIAKRAGKTMGLLGATELSTEVITEIGEKPAYYELGMLSKYDQSKVFNEKIAPLGITTIPTESEKRKPEFKAPSFTNIDDIVEAAKEVWGPTIITAGLIGAGSAGVKKVANIYDQYKTSGLASDIQHTIADIAQTGSDEIFRVALLNDNKDDFISTATYLVANDENFRKTLAQNLTLQNADNPRTPESLTPEEIAGAITPRLESIWRLSKSPWIDRVDLVNYFLDEKGSLADLASPANKELIRQSISKENVSFSELWKATQREIEGLNPSQIKILQETLNQPEPEDPELRSVSNKQVKDYINSQIKAGVINKNQGLAFEVIHRFMPTSVKRYLQTPEVLERVISPSNPQDTLLSSFENVVKSQVENRVQSTFEKVLDMRTQPPDTSVIFRKFEETLKSDPATQAELDLKLTDPTSYSSNIDELISKNPSGFSSWDKVVVLDISSPDVYRESYLKLPETVKFVNRMLNTPSLLWTPRDFSILQNGSKDVLPLTEEALNAVKENSTLLSYSIYKSYQAPIEYYNKINSEIKSIPNLRQLLSQTARGTLTTPSILPYHKWSEEERSQVLDEYKRGGLSQERITELGVAINKSLSENRMNINFTPKFIRLPDGREFEISTPDLTKVSILGTGVKSPEVTTIERLKSFKDIVVSMPDTPSREALSNFKDIPATMAKIKAFYDLVNSIPDAEVHIVDLPALRQKAENWLNYLGNIDDRYKQAQPVEILVQDRLNSGQISQEDLDFVYWLVFGRHSNTQANSDALGKVVSNTVENISKTYPADINDFFNKLHTFSIVNQLRDIIDIPDITTALVSFSERFVNDKIIPLIATYQTVATKLAGQDVISYGLIDNITALSVPVAQEFYQRHKVLFDNADFIPESIKLTANLTVKDYLKSVRGQATSRVSVPGSPIANDTEVLQIISNILNTGKVGSSKKLTYYNLLGNISNSLKRSLEGIDVIDANGLAKLEGLVNTTIQSLQNIGRMDLADELRNLYQEKEEKGLSLQTQKPAPPTKTKRSSKDKQLPEIPQPTEPQQLIEVVANTQVESSIQVEQSNKLKETLKPEPAVVFEDPHAVAVEIIKTAAKTSKKPEGVTQTGEERVVGIPSEAINTFPSELIEYKHNGMLNLKAISEYNLKVAIGSVSMGRQSSNIVFDDVQPIRNISIKKTKAPSNHFILKETDEKNLISVYPININTAHMAIFNTQLEGGGRLTLDIPAKINRFGVVIQKGLIKRLRTAPPLSDRENLDAGLASLVKLSATFNSWLNSEKEIEKRYARVLEKYVSKHHELLSSIYHATQYAQDPRGRMVESIIKNSGLSILDNLPTKTLSEIVNELGQFLNEAFNISSVAKEIVISPSNLKSKQVLNRSKEEKKEKIAQIKNIVVQQKKDEESSLVLYDPNTSLTDQEFEARLYLAFNLLGRTDNTEFENGLNSLVNAAVQYSKSPAHQPRVLAIFDKLADSLMLLNPSSAGDLYRWRTIKNRLIEANLQKPFETFAIKEGYDLEDPREGDYFDLEYLKSLVNAYKTEKKVANRKSYKSEIEIQLSFLSEDIDKGYVDQSVMDDVVALLEKEELDPSYFISYDNYLKDRKPLEGGYIDLSSDISLDIESVSKTAKEYFITNRNSIGRYLSSLYKVYKYIWGKVKDFFLYVWDILSSPSGNVILQRDFSSQFSVQNGPQQLSYKIFPVLNPDLTISDTFLGKYTVLNSQHAAGVFREIFKEVKGEESIVLLTDKLTGQIYEAQRYSLNADDASAIPLHTVAGRAYNYSQKFDSQIVIWVAHNHPSGIPYRTVSDIQQDDKIIELSLDLQGVSFGDSLVITEKYWSSYAYSPPQPYQEAHISNTKDDPDSVYRVATALSRGDESLLEVEEPLTEPVLADGRADTSALQFVVSPTYADQIQERYEKAIARHFDYRGNLRDHLLNQFGIIWKPYQSESVLAGTLVEDIFVVSHIAPTTLADGRRLILEASASSMPFVFAVPEFLGNQLEKIGFRYIATIPQWFAGEYVEKQVYVNNAFTDQDARTLRRYYLGSEEVEQTLDETVDDSYIATNLGQYIPLTQIPEILAPADPHHFEFIKQELSNITASWESKGQYISLLDSVLDPNLPPVILQSLQRREVVGQTAAVHHNGRVYLFADKIESREHLEQLLLHEWFGHEGIQRLNLKLADLYDRLSSDPEFRNKLIQTYGIPYSYLEVSIRKDKALSENEKKALIAEEVLAYIQQSGRVSSFTGWIKQFWGGIREWLRQMGFSFISNLTESDLFYTLHRARLVVEAANVLKKTLDRTIFVSTGTKPIKKTRGGRRVGAEPPLPVTPSFEHPQLDLTRVPKTQWGSAEGGLYITPDQKKYYVKFYRDDDQVRTEFASFQIYKSIGVETPEVHIQQVKDSHGRSRLAIVSKIIPDLIFSPRWGDERYFQGLERSYVASVITKNWDVLPGNIAVTSDHKVILIDAGGSFTFRAQGAPKPFQADINELYTFQEAGRPQRSIFRDTPSRLKSSSVIYDLINLTDKKLVNVLKSAGFSDYHISTHLEALKGRRDLLISELLSNALDNSAISDAFGVMKVLYELEKTHKLDIDPRFRTAYVRLRELFSKYLPDSVKDKKRFLDQELEQTSFAKGAKVPAFSITNTGTTIREILSGRLALSDSEITFNLAGLSDTDEVEVRRIATSIIEPEQDLKIFSQTFQKTNPSLFSRVKKWIDSIFRAAKDWYREKSFYRLLEQEVQPADKDIILDFTGMQTAYKAFMESRNIDKRVKEIEIEIEQALNDFTSSLYRKKYYIDEELKRADEMMRNGQLLGQELDAYLAYKQGRLSKDSLMAMIVKDRNELIFATLTKWWDYLKDNITYEPAFRVAFFNKIASEYAYIDETGIVRTVKFSNNSKYTPTEIDPPAVKRTYDRIKRELIPSSKWIETYLIESTNSNRDGLRDKLEASAHSAVYGSVSGRWVYFPNKSEVSEEEHNRNVNQLRILAQKTNWCTAYSSLEQLERGAHWIFVDSDGKPRVTVYLVSGQISQVRGILPGQVIEPAVVPLVRKFIVDRNLSGGEDFIAEEDLKGELIRIREEKGWLSPEELLQLAEKYGYESQLVGGRFLVDPSIDIPEDLNVIPTISSQGILDAKRAVDSGLENVVVEETDPFRWTLNKEGDKYVLEVDLLDDVEITPYTNLNIYPQWLGCLTSSSSYKLYSKVSLALQADLLRVLGLSTSAPESDQSKQAAELQHFRENLKTIRYKSEKGLIIFQPHLNPGLKSFIGGSNVVLDLQGYQDMPDDNWGQLRQWISSLEELYEISSDLGAGEKGPFIFSNLKKLERFSDGHDVGSALTYSFPVLPKIGTLITTGSYSDMVAPNLSEIDVLDLSRGYIPSRNLLRYLSKIKINQIIEPRESLYVSLYNYSKQDLETLIELTKMLQSRGILRPYDIEIYNPDQEFLEDDRGIDLSALESISRLYISPAVNLKLPQIVGFANIQRPSDKVTHIRISGVTKISNLFLDSHPKRSILVEMSHLKGLSTVAGNASGGRIILYAKSYQQDTPVINGPITLIARDGIRARFGGLEISHKDIPPDLSRELRGYEPRLDPPSRYDRLTSLGERGNLEAQASLAPAKKAFESRVETVIPSSYVNTINKMSLLIKSLDLPQDEIIITSPDNKLVVPSAVKDQIPLKQLEASYGILANGKVYILPENVNQLPTDALRGILLPMWFKNKGLNLVGLQLSKYSTRLGAFKVLQAGKEVGLTVSTLKEQLKERGVYKEHINAYILGELITKYSLNSLPKDVSRAGRNILTSFKSILDEFGYNAFSINLSGVQEILKNLIALTNAQGINHITGEIFDESLYNQPYLIQPRGASQPEKTVDKVPPQTLPTTDEVILKVLSLLPGGSRIVRNYTAKALSERAKKAVEDWGLNSQAVVGYEGLHELDITNRQIVSVIYVASDATNVPLTLFHEAYHSTKYMMKEIARLTNDTKVLEDLGYLDRFLDALDFTPMKKTDRERYFKKYPILRRLYESTGGRLTLSASEHQAVAFSYYASNRIEKSALPKVVQRMFDSIKLFFANLSAYLRGYGFTSAEQIFNTIYSGKIKTQYEEAVKTTKLTTPPEITTPKASLMAGVQMEHPSQLTEKTLLFVHSLDPEKLIGFKGSLPPISIAVVPREDPFTATFGEIFLFGDPDKLRPEANQGVVEYYPVDIYSPTIPAESGLYGEMDPKNIEVFTNFVKELYPDLDQFITTHLSREYKSFLKKLSKPNLSDAQILEILETDPIPAVITGVVLDTFRATPFSMSLNLDVLIPHLKNVVEYIKTTLNQQDISLGNYKNIVEKLFGRVAGFPYLHRNSEETFLGTPENILAYMKERPLKLGEDYKSLSTVFSKEEVNDKASRVAPLHILLAKQLKTIEDMKGARFDQPYDIDRIYEFIHKLDPLLKRNPSTSHLTGLGVWNQIMKSYIETRDIYHTLNQLTPVTREEATLFENELLNVFYNTGSFFEGKLLRKVPLTDFKFAILHYPMVDGGFRHLKSRDRVYLEYALKLLRENSVPYYFKEDLTSDKIQELVSAYNVVFSLADLKEKHRKVVDKDLLTFFVLSLLPTGSVINFSKTSRQLAQPLTGITDWSLDALATANIAGLHRAQITNGHVQSIIDIASDVDDITLHTFHEAFHSIQVMLKEIARVSGDTGTLQILEQLEKEFPDLDFSTMSESQRDEYLKKHPVLSGLYERSNGKLTLTSSEHQAIAFSYYASRRYQRLVEGGFSNRAKEFFNSIITYIRKVMAATLNIPYTPSKYLFHEAFTGQIKEKYETAIANHQLSLPYNSIFDSLKAPNLSLTEKKDLIITHSTIPHKLIYNRGRLVGISTAVTSIDNPTMAKFGPIFFFGKPDKLGPGKDQKYFSADIYSPVVPERTNIPVRVFPDMIQVNLNNIIQEYDGLEEFIKKHFKTSISKSVALVKDNSTSPRLVPRKLAENPVVKMLFLLESNRVQWDYIKKESPSEIFSIIKEELFYTDLDTIAGWADTNLVEPSSVDSFIDPATKRRIEATPENILAAIKKSPLKLGEGNHSLSNIFKTATKVHLKAWLALNLPDLEIIKANRYLLDPSRKNELYHWSSTLSTQLKQLSEYVNPNVVYSKSSPSWSSLFHQTLGKYVELANQKYGENNEVLDPELFTQAVDTFYNAPQNLKEQIYKTLYHEMSSSKSPYFEGKILREVPLSDFAFAIVPRSLSDDYTEFERKFVERLLKRAELPYYKVDLTDTAKIKELVNKYDIAFSLAAFPEKPQMITDIDLLTMDILRIISEGSNIDFSKPSKEIWDLQQTISGWKYSDMVGARVAGLIKTKITNGHIQSIIKIASDAPNKTLHAFHEAFHAIQIMLKELDALSGTPYNIYAQKLKALEKEFPKLDFSNMSEEAREVYTTRYPILNELVKASKGRLIISSSEHQAIAFGYYASTKYQAKMAKVVSSTAREVFDKAIKFIKEISSRILGRPMPKENILFDDLYGSVDISSVAKEIFEEVYSGRIKEQYENIFKNPSLREQARLSKARVITHTISREDLMRVEATGGVLVNPSVAVTLVPNGLLRFLGNEIILVGEYDTLGPEAHPYHTYGTRDLFSPTMSHIKEPSEAYYPPQHQVEIVKALRSWMKSLGLSNEDIKGIRLSPRTDKIHKMFSRDNLIFLYTKWTKQSDKQGLILKEFGDQRVGRKDSIPFQAVLEWFYKNPEIAALDKKYTPIRYTSLYSRYDRKEVPFPYIPSFISEYLARFRPSHPRIEAMKTGKIPPAWNHLVNTLSRYATKIANRDDLDDWTRSLLFKSERDKAEYTRILGYYAEQLAQYAPRSFKSSRDLLLQALYNADEYKNVREGFESVYGKNVPDELIANTLSVVLNIDRLADTSYFEGKLERPVNLSEFKVALIPSDLGKGVKQGILDVLYKHKIKVKYYSPDMLKSGGEVLQLSNALRDVLDKEKLLFSFSSVPEALHNTDTPFIEEVRYHPQAMLFIAPQLDPHPSRLNLEGKPISILSTDTLEFNPNVFVQHITGAIVADRDKNDPNGRLTLRELINFPQLFNLYPTIGDIKVKIIISDALDSPYGWSTDSAIYVQATTEEEAKEILVHEVQHVLDGINGFASGGSPKNNFVKRLADHSYNFYHLFKKKVISGTDEPSLKTDLEIFLEYKEMENTVRKAYKKASNAPITPVEMKKYLAFRWYQRLLGEVMAREVARHLREPQNNISTTEFFLQEEAKKWLNIDFEEAVSKGLGEIEDLPFLDPTQAVTHGERSPVSDFVKERVVSDVTRKLDAHYLTKKTFKDKLNEWVEAARNAWHHLTRLVPSIDPVKYPIVNDIFRRALGLPGTAAEEAMRMVQSVVGGLSESQHQTLSYYLVARQLLARMRAATDPASLSLPFNMMPFDATFDIDKIVASVKAADPTVVIDQQDPLKWVLEHLENKIRKDLQLQNALAKRRRILYDFKVRMVDAGLLDPKYIQYDPTTSPLEPNLSEDYFHAIVSQYADKISLYKVAKTMRLGPKLISQRDRYAGRDFITNYAVSEYHFLYENIVRINQIKLINEFKREVDILPQAREAFNKLYMGSARQIVIERYLPDIQLEADNLWAVGEFAEEAQSRGVPESVIRQEYIESQINSRARKILTDQLYKDKFSDFLKKVYPDYEYVDLEKYQKLVMGYGITSREYQKKMEEAIRGLGIKVTLEELKPMKVLGGPQNPVLIHTSLAEALRYFEREVNKTRGVVTDLLFRINLWTKKWILMTPLRVMKWTLNNISGDIDAAFLIEAEFRKYARGKLTKTFKDLRAFSLTDERDKLPPETVKLIEEAMELRAIHSGLYMTEFDDIRDIALDKPFVGKSFVKSAMKAFEDVIHTAKTDPLSTPGRLASNYIAVLEPWLQARENTLRLLAFKFYMEEITKFLDKVTKAHPSISITNLPNEAFSKFDFKFGASDKREIIYMVRNGYPVKNIAAKLAAELLGDYGAVSPVNKFLAQYVMPFHRFTAMNFNRYLTMYKNLWVDPSFTSSYLGYKLLKLAVGAPLMTLRLSVLVALISLFNALLFPEEWKELYETHIVKGRLPLILGRNTDGTIRTLRIEGAFTQFLRWFNLDSYAFKISAASKGMLDWKEEMLDTAKSPLNMLVQGVMPIVKSPVEAFIMERSTFPDLFNPRPIRDKGEHLSKLLAAEGVWNALTGKPHDPTATWSKLFTMVAAYQVDPYEAAYFESKRMAEKFLDNLGINKPETLPSGRGNNLYFFKKALKVGDRDAALKYLTKYVEDGGDISSLAQSIKQEHPLSSIPIKYRKLFLSSLTPRELEILQIAQTWYKKVYTTEPKLPREAVYNIYRQAREQGQPVFKNRLEELKKKTAERVNKNENVFITWYNKETEET